MAEKNSPLKEPPLPIGHEPRPFASRGSSSGGSAHGDGGSPVYGQYFGQETNTAAAAAGLVHGNMGDQRGQRRGCSLPWTTLTID